MTVLNSSLGLRYSPSIFYNSPNPPTSISNSATHNQRGSQDRISHPRHYRIVHRRIRTGPAPTQLLLKRCSFTPPHKRGNSQPPTASTPSPLCKTTADKTPSPDNQQPLASSHEDPLHARLTSSSETSTSYRLNATHAEGGNNKSHTQRLATNLRPGGTPRLMGTSATAAAMVLCAAAGMAAMTGAAGERRQGACHKLAVWLSPATTFFASSSTTTPCPPEKAALPSRPRRGREGRSLRNPNSGTLLVSVDSTPEVDASAQPSPTSAAAAEGELRKLFSTDVATTSLNVSVVEKASREAGVREREEARDLRVWMDGVREDAAKRGISKKTVQRALNGVEPLPKVIEKDRSQPEMKLTADDYVKRVVSEYRVLRGVQAFNENKELLQRVSAEYGVPEEILVSIWGVESSYGHFTGGFDIIQALVTLAYDKEQPGRAQYFRKELLEAMQIMDDGHGPSDGGRMRGSWAGAMGQCQFMPSSFRAYAVDFDGDRRADIWTSRSDVLASMANYLCKNGWRVGEPYGQKVKLPAGMDSSLVGLKVKKTVHEWQSRHHVLKEEGEPDLPQDALASVVAPDGPAGVAYLACHNFQVVMRYNPSQLYALSICHLAGRLLSAPAPFADTL